jgi:hypothetical protein
MNVTHKGRIDYHDISQPSMLEDDPNLFYGFWGSSINAYKTTSQHEGYKIVDKWKKERFANRDAWNTKILEGWQQVL